MNALSWWRSWHGAPMDHRWSVIAARAGVLPGIVSAVAWALIDYASQQTIRGSIVGFDAEEYAVYSGFKVDDVIKVLEAMESKGITSNGRLVNWEKRQPKREDTTVNERVARHRELKRIVTQSNAPEKESDTDTDTDTDTDGEEDGNDGYFSAHPLSVAFEQSSKITAPGNDPRKWIEACNRMQQLEISPDEVKQAVFELNKRGYTIIGPSSVVNAAINIHAKKQTKTVYAETYQ